MEQRDLFGALPSPTKRKVRRTSLGQFAARGIKPGLYHCGRCDRDLPAEAFSRNNSPKNVKYRYGLADYCRECMNAYQKARLRATPQWQANEAKRQHVRVRAADLEAPKRCSRCGEHKPKTEFFRNRSALDGFYEACKSCENARRAAKGITETDRAKFRAMQARRYANAPEKYRQQRRDRAARLREWLNEKKRGPCADCGNAFHPCQMDFDHRPGEVKLFNVSSLCGSLADMESEIAKCDLVCSNCHRLRTFLRGPRRGPRKTPTL